MLHQCDSIPKKVNINLDQLPTKGNYLVRGIGLPSSLYLICNNQ